ncbi:tripartite tricarboxylate transporter TctB family protein [Limoniibacter endophyticus]|uniref:Membrane protein n=1 Tax=Limoniibacter endophyticus TaxID=1565040 RepID=A0A8J3DL71_9HYPH|nr:tripartite tricarboxylate transporter TctB family protein [Limoniibacter endophyticus]GHC78785.1 membrane protein [Limoniibacter endophyticus]
MSASAPRHNLYAGAIFVAFGAYFALEAMRYELGTAFRMGPGYMPVVLGIVLAILGLLVAGSGVAKTMQGAEVVEDNPPAWLPILIICGVILFFGLTIRGLGFVPVVLISSFAVAMASKLNSLLFSILLAIVVTLICLVVFIIGLGATIPVFGPWMPF